MLNRRLVLASKISADNAAEAELANLQLLCMSGRREQSVPTSAQRGQQTKAGQECPPPATCEIDGEEVADMFGHLNV